MYFFLNDYGEIAHPRILEAITRENLIPEEGYYKDSHSESARKLIQKEIGEEIEADIHFITGGTIANLTMISACLRPHQAVIAPESAHIFTHETGAIEACGHKILAVASADGKIRAKDILRVLEEHHGEHMVEPAMVYITNATELGTVYTREELSELHNVCRENNLYLYCDGARMGSGLMSKYSDVTMRDMAKYTDAFTIGGTKNGAMLGEAIVILNTSLSSGFRFITKQKGGLLAKGKVIGIQFEELFRDGLFYELAEKENSMAQKLAKAFYEKEYSFLCEPQSNQLFPIMSEEKWKELQEEFQLMEWEKMDNNQYAVRVTTSWNTTEEAVDALIQKI